MCNVPPPWREVKERVVERKETDRQRHYIMSEKCKRGRRDSCTVFYGFLHYCSSSDEKVPVLSKRIGLLQSVQTSEACLHYMLAFYFLLLPFLAVMQSTFWCLNSDMKEKCDINPTLSSPIHHGCSGQPSPYVAVSLDSAPLLATRRAQCGNLPQGKVLSYNEWPAQR